MARDRCNCYFLFWAIFCPFTTSPPLTSQKIKIQKKKKEKKKMPGDIIILHVCTKTYDQMMYSSGDTVRDGETDGRMNRTEEQTDRQKKWHIEVGALPKIERNQTTGWPLIFIRQIKGVFDNFPGAFPII